MLFRAIRNSIYSRRVLTNYVQKRTEAGSVISGVSVTKVKARDKYLVVFVLLPIFFWTPFWANFLLFRHTHHHEENDKHACENDHEHEHEHDHKNEHDHKHEHDHKNDHDHKHEHDHKK